jgi:hypothetical protein
MSQNLLLILDIVIQIYQREQGKALKFNENVLLMTLGFQTCVQHPHVHIIRCCRIVRGKCPAVTTER